jgi:hypothetical protein
MVDDIAHSLIAYSFTTRKHRLYPDMEARDLQFLITMLGFQFDRIDECVEHLQSLLAQPEFYHELTTGHTPARFQKDTISPVVQPYAAV